MINIYSPVEIDNDILLLDDEKHELFYSKINSLPQNIQNLLFSLDTEEKLKSIATQFSFDQKKSIELARLTRDILIGDIYLGDILKEVQKRLPVDETTAREIANSLIKEVFTPALEDIKKLHIEKFGKKENTSAQPASNVNPNNLVNLKK